MIGIEYGFDPYQHSSLKVFSTTNKGTSSGYYYLKSRNVLTLSHKYTSSTTMYLSVVGEYANRVTASSEAQDWKWAPEVIVGWVTKF